MFNWESNSCCKNVEGTGESKGEENALADIGLKRVNPHTDCAKS